MLGPFLTRAFVLVLGYAYPAYECYKTVEMNKPEIEQLRFWCQYWILVAMLTVFERIGDAFISWLPMYSEAKLAFFVYLWYSKTRGTKYVYDTFFRPYIAKHETEIDRSLLELRTRAGDTVVICWQRAASYGQTRFFEIMQYVASQSQSSRARPDQQQQQIPHSPSTPAQPPVVSEQPPKSSTKNHLQEPTMPAPSPAHPQNTASPTAAVASIPIRKAAMQAAPTNLPTNRDPNPPPPEIVMEESARITRGRLRRRGGAAPATSGR